MPSIQYNKWFMNVMLCMACDHIWWNIIKWNSSAMICLIIHGTKMRVLYKANRWKSARFKASVVRVYSLCTLVHIILRWIEIVSSILIEHSSTYKCKYLLRFLTKLNSWIRFFFYGRLFNVNVIYLIVTIRMTLFVLRRQTELLERLMESIDRCGSIIIY